MSKRGTKAAVKKAAYEETMKAQPKKTASLPRWVRHQWDSEKDCLKTVTWIGCAPRPGPNWHRERSIDEIEARENAGQRSLF